MNLQDKSIIITGAGGAIAGSVAESFCKAGARLLLVDVDLIRVQGLAASLRARTLEADVSTPEGAERAVAEAVAQFGKVHGLVHLVGNLEKTRLSDSSPEAFDRIFDSNVRSLFYTVRALLPEVRKNDEGFIAGISSQEAWGGGAAEACLFAAAKSAVATFLRSLDAELNDTNIGVTILYPMGIVDTPSNRKLFGNSDAPRIEPRILADLLVKAATMTEGRLLELPVYPPRARVAETVL